MSPPEGLPLASLADPPDEGPGKMAGSASRTTVIRPSRGWAPLRLLELWECRELVYFLTWRDIKVRYRQTALGIAWAIIQPVLTTVVFSLFFGRLAGVSSDGVPYPIWSLVGLVPWTFVANGLTQAANSLVLSERLITKVYFPRLAVPLATVLCGVVDFALGFLVLLGAMFYFGSRLTWSAVWILPLLLLALAVALGGGLWLAALNVRYRDVRHAVPFLTQIWLFVTPVAYPSSLLAEPWRTAYALNPMVGVVEGFRWALLGAGPAPGRLVTVSLAATLLVLVGGMFYFRRMESTFADIV